MIKQPKIIKQSNGNAKTRSPFAFKIRAGLQSAPMGIK